MGEIAPVRHFASSAAIVLSVLLGVLMAMGVEGAPRQLVALVALLGVPGWAIVTRLPPLEPVLTVGIAIVLSLSVQISVALAMLWTGWWHPTAAAVVVLSGACLLCADDLRRAQDSARWASGPA